MTRRLQSGCVPCHILFLRRTERRDDGFVARGFQERVIAAEAAAQAITSLELVVREKELMLELAEIKHDEEKEKMVRPFDPLRRWMKS